MEQLKVAVVKSWTWYRALWSKGRNGRIAAIILPLLAIGLIRMPFAPDNTEPSAEPLTALGVPETLDDVEPMATDRPTSIPATVEPEPTAEPPTAEPPTAVPATAAPPPTEVPPAVAVQPTEIAPPTEPPPAPPPSGQVADLAAAPPDDQPWLPCARGQIKGNVNSSIYHVPGGQSYGRTFRNVYCFNSPQEAQDLGYRAAER